MRRRGLLQIAAGVLLALLLPGFAVSCRKDAGGTDGGKTPGFFGFGSEGKEEDESGGTVGIFVPDCSVKLDPPGFSDGDELLVSAVGNRIYCLNAGSGALGCFVCGGEEAEYREIAVLGPELGFSSDGADTGALAFWADENGFVLALRDRLAVLDPSGIPVSETAAEFPFFPDREDRIAVSRSGKTVAAASSNLYRDPLLTIWDTENDNVARADADGMSALNVRFIGPSSSSPDGGFLILVHTFEDPGYLTVLGYDPKKGKLSRLNRIYNVGVGTVGDGGDLYGFDQGTDPCRFYSADGEDGSIRVLKTIRPEFLSEELGKASGTENPNFRATRVFFRESRLVLYDGQARTAILFARQEIPASDCLRILYPCRRNTDTDGYPQIGEAERYFAAFEERENCKVDAKGISASVFGDHLRLKLLAGETDLDVIHQDKCDEGDLFAAVLRYGLFLPLENEPGIAENFARFADGVKEYMTYDGHLVGIPYRFKGNGFVVTSSFADAGLPIPDADWTLDSFWDLCAMAEALTGDGIALTESWCVTDFFEALIENGVREGRMDEGAFVSTAEKALRYYKSGVLRPFDMNTRYLLENRIHIPPVEREFEIAGFDTVTVLPMPLAGGNRYCPLSSLVYGYAKTDRPGLAVRYLELVSSEEFSRRWNGEKSAFLKDPDSYTFGMETFDGQFGVLTWTKKEFSDRDRLLMGMTSVLMTDMKLGTIDCPEAEAAIREILDQLFAETLTPEEAAGKILTFAKRRYFE